MTSTITGDTKYLRTLFAELRTGRESKDEDLLMSAMGDLEMLVFWTKFNTVRNRALKGMLLILEAVHGDENRDEAASTLNRVCNLIANAGPSRNVQSF